MSGDDQTFEVRKYGHQVPLGDSTCRNCGRPMKHNLATPQAIVMHVDDGEPNDCADPWPAVGTGRAYVAPIGGGEWTDVGYVTEVEMTRLADDPVVRATNPPTMAVRVDGAEIVLPRSHPLFGRIDLVAERGRQLVVIPGVLESPQRGPQRPPLPADCEFLAYVHVHRGVACIMDCHIETDVPVYCEDRQP